MANVHTIGEAYAEGQRPQLMMLQFLQTGTRTYAGTLCATPDAVLVRLSLSLGATQATVLFWKCISSSCFALVAAQVTNQSDDTSVATALKAAPRHVLGLVLSRAILNVSITLAFLDTYAANVLLCYCLNPLISGLLGWCWLHDPLPRRTLVAIIGAAASIAVMALVPLLQEGPYEPINSKRRLGDALAVVTSFCASLSFLIARNASRTYRVPVTLCAAAGMMLSALGSLIGSLFFEYTVFGGISPAFVGVELLIGVSIGGLITCFSVAPRYITAAQTGLISLVQVPAGSLCVFVVYKERPPAATFIGGCCLFAIILSHEWIGLRESAKHTVEYSKVRQVRADQLQSTAVAT